jgi:IS30 family transposase
MTMIDKRPAEVETKKTAGHWEGDLVRHEALHYRVEVKDLRRCAVAAA